MSSLQYRPDGILDPDGKYLNPFTQQPYSKCYYNQSKNWKEYVTWTDHKRIFNMIHKNSILLFIAATGAGKTVIMPKLLLHYFGYQYPIICTTPRQVTTSGAAEFAALCMDVPIYTLDPNTCTPIEDQNIQGKEKRIPTGLSFIGYKFQGSEKYLVTPDTKLLFATDGTIKQMILNDPNLSKYMGVIIDEAHERSVNIDVLMALILDICHRRPEFRVVIMSATIDPKLFTNYFEKLGFKGKYDVYIPSVNNTQYPIDFKKEYRKIDKAKLVDVVYSKIESIILNPSYPPGDILAFVTSEAETVKVKNLINRNMNKYPLNKRPYAISFTANIPAKEKIIATKKGGLSQAPPNTQLAPNGYNMRVIVATNVVESSVTFGDALVYVIESGLAYEKKFDAKNYCYESGKFYVSQASIKQRCGRTGRINPGHCFQLYTQQQFDDEFIPFTLPKIVLEDITKEILSLACLPQHGTLTQALDFIENKMIEPVKNYKDAIKVAKLNLIELGFATESGDIAPLGRVCNGFNKFDLKIAKMIIGGYYLSSMWWCIILGGILQEVRGLEDIFFKPPGMEPDDVADIVLKNMLTFKDNSGDHMTLLKIYYFWSQDSDPKNFVSQYGLNDRKLIDIKNSIQDLYETVKKNATEIKSLWLFGVSQDILTANDALLYSGGGSHNDQNSLDDEIEQELTELENNVTNSINKQRDHQFEDMEKRFKIMQNGGDYAPELRQWESNKYISRLNNLYYRNNILKKRTKKLLSGGMTRTCKNMSGSGKKEEKEQKKQDEDKIKNQAIKVEKIMNHITLKNLKPMYLNIPQTTIEQILGALFYGFSTNLGSYAGVGKKYTVKFSEIKGSITKSILDITNITPYLIIYHEFIVSKEQNRESAKLSIVSECYQSTIGLFLNLSDILKKIS
jgi:HrpA-like RNA helicase